MYKGGRESGYAYIISFLMTADGGMQEVVERRSFVFARDYTKKARAGEGHLI